MRILKKVCHDTKHSQIKTDKYNHWVLYGALQCKFLNFLKLARYYTQVNRAERKCF